MQKHTLRDWILATRPWSFPASAMPVLVTVAWMYVHGCEVSWGMALAALVNIVLVHAAGNVWSDYHDYRQGVGRSDTYGVKILTDGQFTPAEVWRLSLVLQVVAVAMGLVMVWLTGWPLLLIGVAGIALSLLYPPLKYHALGDVVILLCYAVLPMLGMTYILGGRVDVQVLWIAVPVGLITMGILHANNTRDIETDVRAQIKTFPMLTGRRLAVWIYVVEVMLPYLWLVLLVVLSRASWTVLLATLSLPLAVLNARTMLNYRKGGVESYARLDEATAKLQLAFSVLLIVGLSLSLL
ncbi:MAG: prenyltransferase [Bacteroidales bacterium]|nr:prenyltransferase [Bacteroidales bacterium]